MAAANFHRNLDGGQPGEQSILDEEHPKRLESARHLFIRASSLAVTPEA